MDLSLTNLQQDIVRALAYFDVFLYPLTKEQVYAYLPRDSVTIQQLESDLKELVCAGLLKENAGYYFFADRSARIAATRREDERRAATMLKRAFWISLFLKQIPFVRAVFITGSLSKNVANRSSDVDFMIVTAPNRLWISKMILTGIRRMFFFNTIKYFCFNLFVTEKGFSFPEKNVFNAIEIATTQVVWNEAAHDKFCSANPWVQVFLPNWTKNQQGFRLLRSKSSPIQTISEFVLNALPLKSLDAFLLDTARAFWKKRHSHLDEEKFNALFQCKPDISSVWSHDHQTETMNEYRRRLAQFGIRQTA
jgi:hypothetical protein